MYVNALLSVHLQRPTKPPVDGDLDNDAMYREVGDSSGSSSRVHADERQDAMPGLLIPGQSRDEHKGGSLSPEGVVGA